MPHEAVEVRWRFWVFTHPSSSISNEALEIISELNTSFSLMAAMRLIFLNILSVHVIGFVEDVELE